MKLFCVMYEYIDKDYPDDSLCELDGVYDSLEKAKEYIENEWFPIYPEEKLRWIYKPSGRMHVLVNGRIGNAISHYIQEAELNEDISNEKPFSILRES